jgi:hypothetical protein
MQSRPAIQRLLLLLNHPDRWAKANAPDGHLLARTWAAFAREEIRQVILNALRNKKPHTLRGQLRLKGRRLPHEILYELLSEEQRGRIRRDRRRIDAGQAKFQPSSELVLEQASDRQIRLAERLAKTRLLLRRPPKLELPAGFEVTGEGLRRFRDEHVNPIPARVHARLAVCRLCERVFVRALSKRAQIDCQRCRRRWSPKQRWRLANKTARR